MQGWVRPSNWYLTGFLIPVDAPDDESADDDADEDIDAAPESEGLPEENAEEHSSAKKGFFPSSCGVSTLVAAKAAFTQGPRPLGRLRVRARREGR